MASRIASRTTQVSSQEIADQYDMSRQGVADIIFRRNWKYVSVPEDLISLAQSVPRRLTEKQRNASRRTASTVLAKFRTREDQSAAGRLGGLKAGLVNSHVRWHVQRGIIKSDCKLCNPEGTQ